MGSVNSRNNKLYLDFRYRGIRCREQTKLTDTAANRKKAGELLKIIESEINLDIFDYCHYFPNGSKVKKFESIKRLAKINSRTCPNFDVFSDVWKIEKQPEWRASQQTNVADIFRLYLLPEFGHKPVDQISKQDILAFRSALVRGRNGQKLSASRINHILTPLRMVLVEAAERYGFESPWRNIKPIPVPKSDINPFTMAEVMKIICNVRSDFKAYYTLRFFAGLRTGEIDGLTWANIDLKNRQILIKQSLVNGELGPPKTKSSYRAIDMSNIVFEAIIEHKDKFKKSSKFVFANNNGNPLSHRNVSKRIWYPLLALLGIPKRNPYQTRHTTATLWLASGESPEWIARQLGHSNTNMLFTVYSRYVPNLTRKDGSAFEAFLQSNEL